MHRKTDHVEQRQYDQAIQYIFGTVVDKFETLIVRYRDLGEAATRERIENYVGLKAYWIPFKNMNI